MSLEKYASAQERQIAEKLVDDALAAGYVISVYDGEAFALKRSADRAEILGAMASTGSDRLIFRRPDSDPKPGSIGWAWLIWGNDCDLISDCSDNELTRNLLTGAEALAEQLSGDA